MTKNYLNIVIILLILSSLFACTSFYTKEEITFSSGSFRIVGDLRLPKGTGPFPLVIFVHGDGPNNRTSGVTYPPIMERMLRAGYATFAWDKPGTGESTGQLDRSHVIQQRTQIVLDAITVMKKHTSINPKKIGLWGISQAGFVMPRVLAQSKDVAFMIAVSCAGGTGLEQGVYLIKAQALCEGIPKEEAELIEKNLLGAEKATTYEEYVHYKESISRYTSLEKWNVRMAVASQEQWHPPNLEADYFFNPMSIIEHTTIPMLVFFGEKDTQVDPVRGMKAYRAALEHAGNKNFRVELIPGVDHNLIISKTGCIAERNERSRNGWRNYSPLYLDILEKWLRELKLQT